MNRVEGKDYPEWVEGYSEAKEEFFNALREEIVRRWQRMNENRGIVKQRLRERCLKLIRQYDDLEENFDAYVQDEYRRLKRGVRVAIRVYDAYEKYFKIKICKSRVWYEYGY